MHCDALGRCRGWCQLARRQRGDLRRAQRAAGADRGTGRAGCAGGGAGRRARGRANPCEAGDRVRQCAPRGSEFLLATTAPRARARAGEVVTAVARQRIAGAGCGSRLSLRLGLVGGAGGTRCQLPGGCASGGAGSQPASLGRGDTATHARGPGLAARTAGALQRRGSGLAGGSEQCRVDAGLWRLVACGCRCSRVGGRNIGCIARCTAADRRRRLVRRRQAAGARGCAAAGAPLCCRRGAAPRCSLVVDRRRRVSWRSGRSRLCAFGLVIWRWRLGRWAVRRRAIGRGTVGCRLIGARGRGLAARGGGVACRLQRNRRLAGVLVRCDGARQQRLELGWRAARLLRPGVAGRFAGRVARRREAAGGQ